jgi:hypothetical protein
LSSEVVPANNTNTVNIADNTDISLTNKLLFKFIQDSRFVSSSFSDLGESITMIFQRVNMVGNEVCRFLTVLKGCLTLRFFRMKELFLRVMSH